MQHEKFCWQYRHLRMCSLKQGDLGQSLSKGAHSESRSFPVLSSYSTARMCSTRKSPRPGIRSGPLSLRLSCGDHSGEPRRGYAHDIELRPSPSLAQSDSLPLPSPSLSSSSSFARSGLFRTASTRSPPVVRSAMAILNIWTISLSVSEDCGRR